MKRIILILMITLLLTSCSIEPYSATGVVGYSENFPKEFCDSIYEKYPYFDEKLYYYSASPWEAEFRVDNKNISRIALARIDGVDSSDYIAATEISIFIGAPDFSTYIYQSEDAPLPMRDWTIKDVTLYVCNWLYHAPGKSEQADFAQNIMEYHMTKLEEIKVFDRENESAFIDYVKAAYAEPIEGLTGVYAIREEFFNTELSTKDSNGFYLLVRFEENDNIVWLAPVSEKDGMLYLECTVSRSLRTLGESQSYLPLGEEYSQIIAELIGIELEKPAGTGEVTSEDVNTEIME